MGMRSPLPPTSQDARVHPLTVRSSPVEVASAHEQLLASDGLVAAFDAIPSPVLLLDGTQQIVHANEDGWRLCESLGMSSILGLRLGEVLGCGVATAAQFGCGTAPACSRCGSCAAIQAAAAGRDGDGVATIVRGHGHDISRLQLRLRTRPFRWASRGFIVVTLEQAAAGAHPKAGDAALLGEVHRLSSAISTLASQAERGVAPAHSVVSTIRRDADQIRELSALPAPASTAA